MAKHGLHSVSVGQPIFDDLVKPADDRTVEKFGMIGRGDNDAVGRITFRSEEHTSELQSIMRISYAVFCLKKKKYNIIYKSNINTQSNPTTQQVQTKPTNTNTIPYT